MIKGLVTAYDPASDHAPKECLPPPPGQNFEVRAGPKDQRAFCEKSEGMGHRKDMLSLRDATGGYYAKDKSIRDEH
jgi:hypothetical protein